MAKKSPNQQALFDISPEKTKKKPLKTGHDTTTMLVFFRGSTDVSHWSSPSKEVNDLIDSMMKRGYTKVETMSTIDYWEKFNRGQFSLGKSR